MEKSGHAADALNGLTERFQNIVVIMEVSALRMTLMGVPRTLGERLFTIFIDYSDSYTHAKLVFTKQMTLTKDGITFLS